VENQADSSGPTNHPTRSNTSDTDAPPPPGAESGAWDVSDRERAKWDAYYSSIADVDDSDDAIAFGAELAARVAEFLPEGGRLLEAGCGAGQQSMGLARAGFHDLTLMDFSHEALGHARRWFGRLGVDAQFVQGDVLRPAAPEFDLVFNAGVLEHYTFDEQVGFLRGMASRSRRFVLALVPNRLCYWYWIWRVRAGSAGAWPFGKEAPMVDLQRVFEASGLTFLGQFFGAPTWSENFINALPGLDPQLRDLVLTIHRSPVIPAWQKAYLVGALGSHGERPTLSTAWAPTWPRAIASSDETTASLADALALAIAGEQRLATARAEAAATLTTTLAAHEASWTAREASWTARLDEQRVERECLVAAHADREADLAARLDEHVCAVQTLCARLEEQSDRLTQEREAIRQGLEAQLAARARRVDELSEWSRVQGEQLAEIMGGFSWKVLTRVWRLRQRVAPPGSLGARAGKLGLRAARALKRGPAAALATFRGQLEPVRRRVKALVRGPAIVPARGFGVPGLVSVVLPVYNQAYLLASAIESVLNQTYPDFELIVVNDGSADDVGSVLARYGGHPRVRLLTQANQKLPKALSNGFAYARGEFWTWTSADNLMHPEQLARQVAFLRAHPDTAMVYADYLAIDDRGAPLRDPSFRAPNRRTPDAPEIHLPRTTELLNTVNDNFIGPCFLYRGWVGRLVGEYDADFLGVEDWDYWMRINDLFRIAHLGSDETLYQYRVHDNSISGRAVELRIAERALRLLEHERDRAAALGAPWTVRTDAALRARMGDVPPDGTPLLPWPGGAAGDDEKTLYLVDAGSLPGLSTRQGAAVAAWFDGPDAAYAHHVEAARLGCLSFARDAGTAARLEMLGIEAIVAALDGTLPVLALEHARHRRFQESVRRPGAARALPAPFRAADKPLHVLIQVDDFLYGGLENAALGVASGLDPARFRVTLLVLGRQGSAVERARALGVRVVTLPEPYHEGHYRRLLADESVDVVNAHYSLFGASVAGAVGLPFVQVVQNTYVWFGPQEIAAHRAADAHTTAYVCVSAAAARLLDRRVGLPPSKMIVLPNGLDVAAMDAAHAAPGGPLRRELGLARDDFVFLNVSQVAPTKAQVPIVQALAEVLRTHPRAKVVMVGQGHDQGYLDWLDQEIARHGLERSVVRTGPRDDAARFYWMADAFLLPSFWEGWSLALNEAVYAGLPVVASDVGGARDLLSRVGGRLIRPPVDPLDIDPARFTEVSLGHHPGFVADMAGAMRATCDDPGRTILAPDVLWFLDRDRIHAVFADLFSWLAQGGRPDAARAWAAVGEAGRPAARDGHRASAA
jgi:glycosyltransferase involved in cell wall biosynthesis/SAM-dependent methyltransferase